jgi:hypothetical protein
MAGQAGEFSFPGEVAGDRWYWLRQAIRDRADESPSREALALQDRLVAAEPTWPNFAARATMRYQNQEYVQALEDDLEAARLAGAAYWTEVLVEGSERPWEVARKAGQPRGAYELVLRWVDARTSAKRTDRPVEAAAMAMYRLGRYADALQEPKVADPANLDYVEARPGSPWTEPTQRVNAPLVAAMCLSRLGQQDRAQELLAKIRERVKQADAGLDPELLRKGEAASASRIDHALLEEARRLIEPEGATR